MGNPIHIALTFDDNFWAPAYTTMRSICMFTRRRGDLVFHLCHTGLSPEHVADLEKITAEYGARLRYYDLSITDFLSQRVSQLPTVKVKRLHQIVYARLFLFEILPKGIERILFLDCDLYVRINIERLYEMDLGDKIAAAALDPYRTGYKIGRDAHAKAHYDTADPYLNGGVILFGPECARIDFVGEIVKLVPPEIIDTLYFDQDIVNLVLAGRWKVLSHRWNFQNPIIADERVDPFIFHYTGAVKPWQIRTKTAFKRLYRHTMTNELFYRYWRHRYRGKLRSWLSRLTGR